MKPSTFKQLNLTMTNLSENTKDFLWKVGEEEYCIKVKQFLPIEEKLDIVSKIVNNSTDDNGYYNVGLLEVNTYVELIYAYTDIKFTKSQKENPHKIYDLMSYNDFFDKIFAVMNSKEIDFIRTTAYETIKSVYAYKNSAYGILDSLSQGYEDLNFDVNNLYAKLSDKDNLNLLRNVVNKMG